MESEEIVSELSEINSLELIRMIIQTISSDKKLSNKKIKMDNDVAKVNFKTDIRLLRRALTNLLRNALEASNEDEEVLIGCNSTKKEVIFWVQNKAVLTDEVKSQIFQRFYSTKGPGRGLGTFSTKILIEEHLNGQVNFESSEKVGTIFRIILPLKVD